MPKPYSIWSGNSLHVHLSILDAAGVTDLTPEASDSTSISAAGRQFIAGLLHRAAALTGLSSPTANSYKRLQPGSWAPANTYWGYGNRSGVIRIPGYGRRRHIEYRAGDNTAHPELFLIGLLAAGMDGIRRRLVAPEPFSGDVGHMSATEMSAAGLGFLPRTLPEALDALAADDVIRNAIGDTLLTNYLRLRRAEYAHYELQVHAWEREIYFPIA
jgi:glutamine synthetase